MTMTRDELKGRQTPGQCEVTDDGRIWGGLDFGDMIADVWIDEHANAALYAEAHNVANRTGMWPEDLVDRVKELEEAMGDPGFWGRAAARNGQKAAELERRVKELEEALRPFTHPDLCETLGGNVQGDESPLWARNRAMLKLGHFKTASATLNRPTP